MAVVTIEIQENVAQYVQARERIEQLGKADIFADLIRSGFEQKLKKLYKTYQEGEISFSYLAEQLGMTTWQTYHLLEERGWRTANI